MLARSLTDRSVTPNYDPISEASLFTIKVHHGGSFVRGPTRGYIGGKVVFFDYVNRTMISLSDFKTMAEQCGYDKESVVFWHKYSLTLYKVRLVGSNIEVAKLATCIPKDRVIEIYFEHLNFYHDDHQHCERTGMDSLPISDTEANSDDSHDDDFEDFDYSLEEDDILLSKYIDPSAESFGININQRNEKNDENQDYVNEKMQNVEGDSDCVDSDDTGSLNSDYNSENEDSNFPKHNPKTDALNPKLELGMIFGNKKKFKEAVIANQAKIGKSIEWIKDDRRRARAK
ncbi:hypothetical protein KY285_007507 [Solanum tuberosum]|nr:hypothetical protein KY285_007507 [Solanum tuberosum]